MKKLTVILMVAVSFLATHVLAGTLTVNGDLATATNLSAQSITLGGVMQTNWPSTSAVGAIDLTSAVLDFSQTALLYRVTLTNNISWVFTNHVAGRIVYLQITENGTGGWTNTWPAGLLWPENQIINASTVSNDISVYEILDNGSSWLAQAEGLDYGVACTNDCYALAFNGGNNITVDQTSLWAPTNFTFEAWVKSNKANRVVTGARWQPQKNSVGQRLAGWHSSEVMDTSALAGFCRAIPILGWRVASPSTTGHGTTWPRPTMARTSSCMWMASKMDHQRPCRGFWPPPPN
jgi:hypothetical protein